MVHGKHYKNSSRKRFVFDYQNKFNDDIIIQAIAYTIYIKIILILLGEEIIHEVKKYTGDLRTGFGSFIEKNLAPFSSAYPENNCRKKDIKCDQPYSFIHKVNMI